jgi:hypothetical protein
MQEVVAWDQNLTSQRVGLSEGQKMYWGTV